MEDLVTKYVKGELTIFWKPTLCIHSTKCFTGLPAVFNPDLQPWVNPKNGSTKEIIEQIDKCPSGALSYVINNNKTETLNMENKEVKIQVTTGGPLLVKGKFNLVDENGNETIIEGATSFCRCGASKNKPFCDNSHYKINFDTKTN